MKQSDRKYLIWIILGMIACHTLYFILGHVELDRHDIAVGADEKIPFCEWFVIPYVLWYFYVLLSFLYLLIISKKDFLNMGIYVVMGLFICCTVFVLYPSQIAFRPESFDGDNICASLVELIFAMDKPYNVLPSIHCFESAAIFFAFCKAEKLRGRKTIKIFMGIMAALICLSTVFIKQHSLLDMAAGIGIAVILYFIVYRIKWPWKKD